MHRWKTPCEDEGRDQDDASTSQEMPNIASKQPEAKRQAWNRCPLATLGRNPPCWDRFLASRTVRQWISVVKPLSLWSFLQRPWKTNTNPDDFMTVQMPSLFNFLMSERFMDSSTEPPNAILSITSKGRASRRPKFLNSVVEEAWSRSPRIIFQSCDMSLCRLNTAQP